MFKLLILLFILFITFGPDIKFILAQTGINKCNQAGSNWIDKLMLCDKSQKTCITMKKLYKSQLETECLAVYKTK